MSDFGSYMTKLEKLLSDLAEANADLRRASDTEAKASRDKTIATNVLNEKQKAVDAVLRDIRKGSAGGDWRRNDYKDTDQ